MGKAETMAFELRPLSHALGAEIIGVDLTRPVSDAVFGQIEQAFLASGILLFRNQDLTPEQHIAFSRRFGELDRHDSLPRDRHPQYPEILMVTNRPKEDGSPSDSRYTGRKWHSDMSFTLCPALGSLLHSREIPSVGGDTMFANMTLAYETLSDGMKQMIADLHGIHLPGRSLPFASAERLAEDRRLNPPIAQPIVRTHWQTGRKALYISEKVEMLEGMTREESEPIIRFLCEHAAKHEFIYRHQWKKHDLLIWDNRCTMHIALADFDETKRRELHRTTVLGKPSGHVYTGPM
jgi:taurine dioxygenase